MKRLATWIAVLALLLLGLRWWPHAPLLAGQGWSHAVLASDGSLLRLALAPDDHYRLPLAHDEIPAAMRDAVLLYEDRWFYWHPGVNPAALVRSAWASASGGRRQGGSTITMQLARRLYRIDSRSIGGKLRQAAAALWIEARHGKREILEAYLNLAPYGGNVEGVGAASMVYLRKPAAQLVTPEILALAVIPQNPNARLFGKRASRDLLAARMRLWDAWQARRPDERRWTADMALPLRTEGRNNLPFLAPHAVDLLLRERQQATDDAATGHGSIRSSIDPRSQAVLEKVIAGFLRERAASGIRNASAMLLDSASMEVKALVGSAGYFDPAIAGMVNGALARRSPGSTLKPFIYALALDQGVLHPKTILRDTATSFGAFTPENFDGRYAGPVSAEDALIRSRNVPAVGVASKLARPDLYDFLKQAGVARMASREHYGLALVLGGGEVTMEELAQMYAMLANGGVWRPLSYRRRGKDEAAPDGERRLLSEEAAFITLDMLRRNPRPDTLAPARPAIGWKTGTSWGFRDAWTAGVSGRLVLVVWLGNFDGAGNPALVGVDLAAPLFLRIADALRAERLDAPALPRALPKDLRQVEVCAASGDLPDEACPRLAPTWFIAGKSPIRRSALHRRVVVDGDRVGCAPGAAAAGRQARTVEVWSSELQQLMREAGMPLRDTSACAGDAVGGQAPRILSPLRGVRHTLRLGKEQPLVLRADASGDSRELAWFVDGALVGRAAPGAALLWHAPRAGRYQLRVVDGAGRADVRDLDVDLAP